jgi:hypothetical protein
MLPFMHARSFTWAIPFVARVNQIREKGRNWLLEMEYGCLNSLFALILKTWMAGTLHIVTTHKKRGCIVGTCKNTVIADSWRNYVLQIVSADLVRKGNNYTPGIIMMEYKNVWLKLIARTHLIQASSVNPHIGIKTRPRFKGHKLSK